MQKKSNRKKMRIVGILISTVVCVGLIVGVFTIIMLKIMNQEKKELTWDEFQVMSQEEQMKFIDSFGIGDGFEKWMNSVHPEESEILPWEVDGAKKIVDYTWQEFEALDQINQEIFIDSFGEEFTFDQWLEREQPKDAVANNEAQVDFDRDVNAYSWEEFESMSKEQQEIFINRFEDDDSFNAWLERESKNDISKLPWQENDGKSPEEYTWEDFNALTESQQMAFVDYWDSKSSFEIWLEQNQP